MISNATLKEIGETLLSAKSVLLFPHENPDGDSIGSCVALCTALRKNGVDVWTLIDEPLTDYIGFIDDVKDGETPCCTTDKNCIENPEICMFVDCCGDGRIPGREDKFHTGGKSLCIDHHETSESSEDMFYVDGDEAAAVQIIFKLLKACDIEIDRRMANALYTGICTDTGNFKYSNTTAETHRIAAELYEIGIDHTHIMVKLYQNVDFRETKLESEAIRNIEFFAGGKAALACVTQELLHDVGAGLEHADDLINVLRDIKGVEVGVVLKQSKMDTIKASFRAKSYADVGKIAYELGGGGHARASGCTLHTDIDTAKAMVMKKVEEELEG